jgi:cytochrome c553
MKIASMLQALVLLLSWNAAGAGDIVLMDEYDDYTSAMLQAYKKEQETCDVAGRELECLSAQYEMERVANYLDTLQRRGGADDRDRGRAPDNFWGM